MEHVVYAVVRNIHYAGFDIPSLITRDREKAIAYLDARNKEDLEKSISWTLFTYVLGIDYEDPNNDGPKSYMD